MTTAQIAERKNLYRMIQKLPEDDFEKIASYTAFLQTLRDQEDAEDLACYKERMNEPSFSLEEVKRELGLL